MKNPNEINSGLKKVFFITSNKCILDQDITYEIPQNKGLTNLRAGASNAEFHETIKFKNDSFSIYVNSIGINTKDLIPEEQDPKTQKYNINISIKYNQNISSSIISFIPDKDNFLYNFSYEDNYQIIKFTHLEQLKIYIKYMKTIKLRQTDQLFKELINDSQNLLLDKKINLDFYLEIFKNCYSEKQFQFLSLFKLKNILLTPDFDYKEYSPFLNIIEQKPEIQLRYCTNEEDKNKYSIILYTLIFFVKYNYDKEKSMEMLQNENLWQYLIKILPVNANFFPNLKIPDNLIRKMFEQNLNIEIIKGIFILCGNTEKILDLINNKIEVIANCYSNEHKLILMSSLNSAQKKDNLENIIEKMENIIIS